MPRKIRQICSICDKELPPVNAAPNDVADVRYVNQSHRACIPPKEKPVVVDPALARRGPGRPRKVVPLTMDVEQAKKDVAGPVVTV